MNTTGEQHASQAVDLSKYAQNIISHEDHPLFDEAVEAGKAGALRAAYVMIWLACAESLKRRFREAQMRDGAAGKVVGEIEKMESQHKAVDKFLLAKAHNYGFLSNSANTILNQVYEMRCLYGHPYQEAPSPEKVIDAAATVVELVLSKPVKLRHGFGKQLIDSLLNDANFLDDHEPAVAAFTKSIFPRLDESVHAWLLDEYWNGLEKLSYDSSMAVFSRRGMWFCRTRLVDLGTSLFSHDEWHNRAGKLPKTLMGVCGIADIFNHIGERAQDSLVGSILDESKAHASVLTHLERLNNKGALSSRQQGRFTEAVRELGTKAVRPSRLSTKTCYAKLIDAMESYNWYIQNPAIDTVLSNGPAQAAELTEEQQMSLGRNILQAGEGQATSAIKFLERLSHDARNWPLGVIRGVALESFTNENNEIRLKNGHLDLVVSALGALDDIQRDELIVEIVGSLDVGTPRYSVNVDDYPGVIRLLNDYEWAAPLARILETKLSE